MKNPYLLFKAYQNAFILVILKHTIYIYIFCFPVSGRKNLALRKPAYQSSTTNFTFGGRQHRGVAEYAVDGNLEVELEGSTCIRAGWDLNPWWAVDLQDIYRIDEVAIVTRNWGNALLKKTF